MTNSIESNELISESYEIEPRDSRCRYWAKKIEAKDLPMPENVSGANDLPGSYLKNGEIEIFPGEYVFEGEANHHRNARGWTYGVVQCGPALKHGTETKDDIKALVKAGLLEVERAKKLLKGSGDIAACVRHAHLEEIKKELGISGSVKDFLEEKTS